MNLKTFNKEFKKKIQPILDRMNNQIAIPITCRSNLDEFCKVTRKPFTEEFAFQIYDPEKTITKIPDNGSYPEMIGRFFIESELIDHPKEINDDLESLLLGAILSFSKELGFLPNQAQGDTYISADWPGNRGYYLRMLECGKYEFRLYSNCRKL